MTNRFKRWIYDYWALMLMCLLGPMLLLIIWACSDSSDPRESGRTKADSAMQEYFQSQIDNGADRYKLEARLLMCQSAIRSGSYTSVYKTPIGKLACPQDDDLYYK